jgi:hypothetical protein
MRRRGRPCVGMMIENAVAGLDTASLDEAFGASGVDEGGCDTKNWTCV